MQTHEVLQKAADIIKSGGWIRGRYKRGNCYCMLGAIGAAANIEPYSSEILPLTKAVRVVTDDWPGIFNDNRCKSKEDAIAALEIAAACARHPEYHEQPTP